jgi:hypothetical protein
MSVSLPSTIPLFVNSFRPHLQIFRSAAGRRSVKTSERCPAPKGQHKLQVTANSRRPPPPLPPPPETCPNPFFNASLFHLHRHEGMPGLKSSETDWTESRENAEITRTKSVTQIKYTYSLTTRCKTHVTALQDKISLQIPFIKSHFPCTNINIAHKRINITVISSAVKIIVQFVSINLNTSMRISSTGYRWTGLQAMTFVNVYLL